MDIRKEDIEIMAPVGSFESLMAAIQGGANSIYFGIEQLNMRSRSSNNFTTDDLRTIVATCKENNVKSYLTVNTIIYDHDIKLMKGDCVYMFSDGFPDQFGGNKGKKFKYKPFKDLLMSNVHKPMSEQMSILDETFTQWKGRYEQVDDVVIIGVKL